MLMSGRGAEGANIAHVEEWVGVAVWGDCVDRVGARVVDGVGIVGGWIRLEGQ